MGQLGRCTWAILHKDLLMEWRSKERLNPMVVFVLLVLLIFNFSFELGGAALHEIGPGVLWSAFVFASLLGLNRTFAAEGINDCLDGLLLAPGDRASLYLGKMLGNLIFLLATQLASLPFFALFFNLSPGTYLAPLLAVLILGSIGLAAVGTLFAAVSSNMRLQELLLPLLFLPMVIAPLIFCVEATALVLKASPLEKIYPYMQLLGAYDLVFITLAFMLFEFVVEE